MKYKNFHFQIVALLIFSLFEPTYSKDQPESEHSQITDSSSDNFNKEHQLTPTEIIQRHRMQEEALDNLKKQADQIVYSLEQVEQVLNANKINFDEYKVTKKQLLQEIKDIKTIIENLYEHISILPTVDATYNYLIFNKCFLNYLLPCFKKDITLLTAENFAIFIENIFNPESEWSLESNQLQPDEIAILNEKNCTELITASEQVGLTTFNKAFRTFQDKPVIFNQSAMSLFGYGAATIGTIGLTCALISYIQTTTPYTEKESKSYIELFQDFIGREVDTKTALEPRNATNSASIDAARASFGLGNHLDTAAQKYVGKLITPITLFLYSQGEPIYNYAKEKSSIAYKKTINYLRGEVDTTSNSIFESSTQKVYFKDMIGSEYLEERALQLADFIKHPQRYQNAGIIPTTGILLTGPSQTGKSYFAQALQTLINEENDEQSQAVKFMYITQELIWKHGLDRIFEYARDNAPYILFIDEVDMIGARRDKDGKTTNDLMTNMSGLNNDKNKQVIVIAATNRPEELDFALLQDGRFGDQIRFELPSYNNRKTYLIKSLIKRNITILDNNYIDAIAQETEGCTYNTLDKIIRCASIKAKKEARPVRNYDFEASLDSELRKIQPNTSMNEEEKKVVAIYHAGQAVVRHILETIQQVIKITIHGVDKPVKGKEGFEIDTKSNTHAGENINLIKDERMRAIKLGNVFTLSSSNNKELISDKDEEDELMALLAGQAALELINGQCYNNFGKEDRAKILHTLELKISQGTVITETIRQQALIEKDRLYAQVKSILQSHLNLVQDISNALIKNYTINRSEFISLTENYIK